MRKNHKLTREQAIEEYVVCQVRLYEFLHVFQIATEIIDGKYRPSNEIGHGHGEFIGSLRTASAGLFASLVDRSPDAIDIFDVWLVLFPGKKPKLSKRGKQSNP